ncbi:uncharacterized protein K452DRAFT_231111 [Aplosporella prunicola CBS 121167]|uniref:NADH-cytochrome b5 reductase n=1 Tax=Aplosporella prunicola CBS 121167 TaxID=1176127 RepID=A0A6A6B7D1_9PEZI|nr:uncharacterized protein K452DRAFT_231111 [Aplosporella prunicola CBS 121167]KAF2139806.1 hypothetical protein K452DRAFT_231111 [Aplosporella prunicola CBS 121167]
MSQATFGSLGPRRLALDSVQEVNHNTKLLRFKLPNAGDHSGLALTSSVLTLSWPQGGFLPTVRPYTPVSHSDEQGHLDLLVKRYPQGKGSGYLHSLTPGQTLTFMAAIRGYAWKPNQYPHITMIAGGAGITPMYQLIQGILKNPEDKTKITLVFGNNSDEDILLKKELDAFARQYPSRFDVHYTVSNPAEGSPHRKGHVTKEFLQETIGDAHGRNTKIFLCGPPAMEAALAKSGGFSSKQGSVLEQLGYTKDMVYKF